MNKEQEFRKQTEEAKFEAFSVMCEKVNELEKENAELKKRIEWLDMAIDCDIPVADKIAELEKKIENIRNYLAYNIPHELINEATNKIWHMI